MSAVEMLFDEFAARHARGEHPDAREYLARAGASRDELAGLLDGYLAAAPVQPPGEETVAAFAALLGAEAPLLAERVRRGWRREEIVDWICERFGIGEAKREKVARYWHELETGLLPVSGVSEQLRDALRERFGEAAGAAGAPVLHARAAYLRRPDAGWILQESIEPPAAPSPAAEPDEVDRLFVASPLGSGTP